MDKDKLQALENDIRKAFEEQSALQDVQPPADFLRSVMDKLPEQAGAQATTASFSSRVRESVHAFFRMLQRPVTLRVTPLQVAASLALVLCSVVMADFVSDMGNGTSRRIAAHSSDTPQSLAVNFTLPDPDRTFVSAAVIGSFNKWEEKGFEMTYNVEQQAWVLQHELPPGDYKYVFLVNGNAPVVDPHAVFYVQDSFGNRNALLQVGGVQHEV